ncbi:MAG: hypothetical protein PWR26_519, partial [Methanosarcinales archaeon]|nr:hypothetical protein [Methanosarcinales archaeon]
RGLTVDVRHTLEKNVLVQHSSTTVRFVVHGTGRCTNALITLSPSAGLKPQSPPVQRVTIGEGKDVEISYTLRGQKRGRWAVGTLTCELDDALGLFVWRKRWRVEEAVEVYVKMGGELTRSEGMGGIRRRRARSPTASSGTKRWAPGVGEVRRFSPGDSLRWIDWKLTAKIQRPMVKQPERIPEAQLVLMLDISKSMETGSGAVLEAAIEAAAIVYGLCAARGIPMAMLTFKESKPTQLIPTGAGKHQELQITRELSHINGEAGGKTPGGKTPSPLITTDELSMLRKFVLSSALHDPEVACFFERIQPFVESIMAWKDVSSLELYQAMTDIVKRGKLQTKVVVITSLMLETTPLFESLRLARYNGFEIVLAALSPKLSGQMEEYQLFKEKLRILGCIPDIRIFEIESMGELAQLSSIVD